MPSIQPRHGSRWFPMRVPLGQRAKHGEVVRLNLQTADRDVARVPGTALAARWLARFSQLDLIPDKHLATTVGEQVLIDNDEVAARSDAAATGAAGAATMIFDAIAVGDRRGPRRHAARPGAAGAMRSALFSQIPTMVESALQGFVAGAAYGLLAPAGTPAEG